MRLFVAIPIEAEITCQLTELQRGLKDVRWVAPENMHITLRFIGEADRATLEDIDVALSDISAPAFDIDFADLGAFDKGGKVHTVYAAVVADPTLIYLRDKIESAIVRAGFAAEPRHFKPHVTLARMAKMSAERVAPFLESGGGFRAGPMTVDRFTLYQSHLGHGGVHYEPLIDYPLQSFG